MCFLGFLVAEKKGFDFSVGRRGLLVLMLTILLLLQIAAVCDGLRDGGEKSKVAVPILSSLSCCTKAAAFGGLRYSGGEEGIRLFLRKKRGRL